MDYIYYQYWGMNLFWWFFALSIVVWIFGTPYKIPSQRSHKLTPLESLKQQFADGTIHKDEFLKLKNSMQSK
jgi:putative membrane protein